MLVYEERFLSKKSKSKGPCELGIMSHKRESKECRGRSPLPGCGVSPPTPQPAAEGGVKKKIKEVTKTYCLNKNI